MTAVPIGPVKSMPQNLSITGLSGHDAAGIPTRFEVAGKAAYLIGIGGCGMSGLARMLLTRGARVSGSDKESGETTELLMREGVSVGFDQTKAWLPESCDLVIASAAIKPDHPQLKEASRRGIETLTYAQALGRCMVGRTGVAIAGTHGKSTTTAMLGAALVDAGLDPTVIVGATCAQLAHGTHHQATDSLHGAKPDHSVHTGFRLGSPTIPAGSLAGRPGLLLAEACEFNRSFHHLHPTIASISSVEADHLDIYGTLDAVVESFHRFARLVPSEESGGKLLIAHEGAHRREVTAGLECRVRTIGFSPDADYSVAFDAQTRRTTITHDREPFGAFSLMLPGAHNAMNAATAVVLASWLGADLGSVTRSLSRFRGVERRTQFLGEKAVSGGTVRVFDDYGHHPTEIDSTLRALRESERPESRGGRLICVFQPHQHSRTRHLMDEFAGSFSHADIVIVPHIYFVRDSAEEKQKVSAEDLVARLHGKGVGAKHIDSFEEIVEELRTTCRANDLVVVMGAGPVWKVAKSFLASDMPR